MLEEMIFDIFFGFKKLVDTFYKYYCCYFYLSIIIYFDYPSTVKI